MCMFVFHTLEITNLHWNERGGGRMWFILIYFNEVSYVLIKNVMFLIKLIYASIKFQLLLDWNVFRISHFIAIN